VTRATAPLRPNKLAAGMLTDDIAEGEKLKSRGESGRKNRKKGRCRIKTMQSVK
jgi:hypothetical protein